MADPVQGSVVWAMIADRNGHKKCRPAVILTPTNEIVAGTTLVGVAVTGTPTIPKPPRHVELPSHPNRHPETGLYKKCWAVCEWVVTFVIEEIDEVVGQVPESHFILIQAFVKSKAEESESG